ncbi:MAG: type II 3-dehydroquinate dehydratase [Proteobacteria bacterium]|nr:type II 3-dehydroquinate dehydratase [Pseudomonadota bacterium]
MKILVINGPNLNMLGSRDKSQYGSLSLKEIEKMILEEAKKLKIGVSFFQSNEEGKIVTKIQQASNYDGIIINAGAYTHTSIAIRDALEIFNKPVIEVHLSNIFAREPFRHNSYISSIAKGVIAGFKENSYVLAIRALYQILNNK